MFVSLLEIGITEMNINDPWAFGWTQVLTLVGFLITIVIAISGFRTFGRWKRERIEERRIDIAFDALSVAAESKIVLLRRGYERRMSAVQQPLWSVC